MTEISAHATMQRETRVRRGAVAETVGGMPVEPGFSRIVGDEFLLREEGLACHYAKGRGITVQMDDPALAGTLELFLAGSVYSAVAAINGLTAIHASAIESGGKAIAFTGAPGAGKSTTAASLRQAGFAIVADDTLVLDMADGQAMCLPGHKRLKLWPDSLAMTGMPAMEMVSEDYRKFFATESGSEIDAPLPLGAIVALEVGEQLAFETVHGADRIAVLDDDHYTAEHRAMAQGASRAERLGAIARLANAAPVYRFTRPIAPDRFAGTVRFLAARLAEISGGTS